MESQHSDTNVYSLEKSIDNFFQRTSVPRKICDAKAFELVGGSILQPAPIQGSWIYTVFGGLTLKYVIQFRLASQPLDTAQFMLAAEIHPELVPTIQYHGELADGTQDGESVLVHVIDRVPGETYLEVILRDTLPDDAEQNINRRRNLIIDIARFYAQSWNTPQTVEPADKRRLFETTADDLQTLLTALPVTFRPGIQKCIDCLPNVFELPMELMHLDFGEMNIMVDPETSKLTGVIDWDDAEIRPFGQSIHTIEKFCGKLHLQQGWLPFVDHDDLRALFWDTFIAASEKPISAETLKSIKISCIIGLLLEKGFNLRKCPRMPIIDDEDGRYNMLSLKAFLLDSRLKFDEA